VWEVVATPRAEGGAVLVLRDVTEQARAMQVRTDFAANASHELRTPVAAMRVAMDTLEGLGDGEDPALKARFMGMIARNIDRLEAMVRDLLDLSRLEAPASAVRRERVEMAGVIADLEPLYERVLKERSLRLAFEVAPGAEELSTDRNLLLLILGNLIDNATKYAFEGTEVRVSVRRLLSGTELDVADKGIGIPLDQQQRIFERYYQVDAARSVGSPRRGTGLGLSIVKHAAKRLGGTIRVESVWQQGTRMVVNLPDQAVGGQKSVDGEGAQRESEADRLV
jgi:two-component system, OmpR family, phosphate regulon sensor histidine kinase PhoR